MKKTLLLMTMIMTMFTFVVKSQITLFYEGFESVGLPAGWSVIDADGDGQTWMHSSHYSMDGHESDGAYISISGGITGGSPDNWLITPPITLIGNCELSFYRLVGFLTPSDRYGVYVSTTSADDPSEFFPLYEETPTSATYAWPLRTINLADYAGNTVYIAFRHFPATNQLLLSIDDITVTSSATEPIITAQPSGLSFIDVPAGSNSTKQLTVNTYNITGDITASVASPFEISIDSNTFAQTATLTPSVTDLYVRYAPQEAGVDSTVLTLTNGTVSTNVILVGTSVDCNDIILPYSQDFASTLLGSLPACWSQINPYNGYPKTTNEYTEDNVLMFKCNYSDPKPIYAVLPIMPENLSNLQMTFLAFREGNGAGTFSVGYVTDPADSSTFVPIWSITGTDVGDNNPHTYVVSFNDVPTAPATNYYIALKYMANSNKSWLVDDILVEAIPLCGAPHDLSTTILGSNSVVLQWYGYAPNYNLYYMAESDTGWTMIPNIFWDENGYLLNNLTPATTYNWYVEAHCDNDSIIHSVSDGTFTTDCETFTAPFNQDFDASSNLPSCWGSYVGLADNIFAGAALTPTTSYYSWKFNNVTVFDSRHAKLNIYGTDCRYWLVTPAIDLSTLTNPALTFELALTKYNSTSAITDPQGQLDDKFMVIISTDNGATWSAANATVWSNDNSGDYVFNQIATAGQDITISLADYIDQTVKIAFYGESTVTNGDNDLHIDNIMVTNLSTCPKPLNFVVTSVTNNGVTLSWDENGSATNWNVEYGPTGFEHGDENATLVNTSINPLTINNLTTGTYDFYVQSNCGEGQSYWVGPQTATVGSYNMGINGSDTLTTCGTIIFDNGGAENNYSAGCSFTLVLYPEIADNSVALTGDYNTEEGWDILYIYDGVGTTGTLLGEYSGTGSLPTLVSSSGPLTIKFTSDDALQKPGFTLYTSCVSCLPPANLTISNITDVSADLTWSGTSSEYIVTYMAEGGTNPVSFTTTDTSYSLTGLIPTTSYVVNVSGACDEYYSTPATLGFTTMMTATGVPYSTDFSANSDQNWFLNNGDCANKWVVGAVNDTTNALFVTNNGTTPGYNQSSFSTVTAEKLFTIGQAGYLQISFDVKIGGETEFDYLKVFFSPADTTYPPYNSFIYYSNTTYSQFAVDFSDYLQYSGYTDDPYTFNLTQGNIVHVSVTMPNPNSSPSPTSTAKLVFLWKNDHYGGSDPGAIIYNVSIDPIACPTPMGLAASDLTSSSANITWSQGGEETDWNLKFKKATSTNWTEINISGEPNYELSGLEAETLYEVSVQSICSEDEQSPWMTIQFYTPVEVIDSCETPTDLRESGVVIDKSTGYLFVEWTDNAGASQWHLQYREQGTTAWTTVLVTDEPIYSDFTGLEANTTYELRVQAVCDNGMSSGWSNLLVATAQGTGIENFLDNSIVLFPNPAREYVDIRVDGDVNVTNIEVFDVYGKLIWTDNHSSIRTAQINVSGLATGMYFVRVTTDEGAVTKTFVKQ